MKKLLLLLMFVFINRSFSAEPKDTIKVIFAFEDSDSCDKFNKMVNNLNMAGISRFYKRYIYVLRYNIGLGSEKFLSKIEDLIKEKKIKEIFVIKENFERDEKYHINISFLSLQDKSYFENLILEQLGLERENFFIKHSIVYNFLNIEILEKFLLELANHEDSDLIDIGILNNFIKV